jgi:hypothetical protein
LIFVNSNANFGQNIFQRLLLVLLIPKGAQQQTRRLSGEGQPAGLEGAEEVALPDFHLLVVAKIQIFKYVVPIFRYERLFLAVKPSSKQYGAVTVY